MKSLVDFLGSHVVTEMSRKPWEKPVPTQVVEQLPVSRDSALVAFLARQEALKLARKSR